MRVHVVTEQISQSKAFVTKVTLVRFLTIMRQHVVLKLGLITITFAAASTTEWFLLMQLLMRLHVLKEGKVLPTVRTFVWLLACVDDEMLLQVAAESKALATHFALVGLVLGMNAHMQL